MIVNTTGPLFAELETLGAKRRRVEEDIANLELTIAGEKNWLAGQMQNVDAQIAECRAAIEADLRASGETSLTDPATGINAHFKQQTSWKVTNKDDLFAAAKERPELGLLVEVADEKKAVALSKSLGEPLPGVECIESQTFTILPPKGKK